MPKSIGLLVDGPFDEEAVAALLRKLRPGIGIVSRVPGRSFTKTVGILKADLKLRTCDGVIWVTDAEADDPLKHLMAMRSRVRKEAIKIHVECVVAVKMMEAWLLADDLALGNVVGIQKTFLNPETLEDPKRELLRLLTGANKTYTAQQARRIADAIDLAVVAKRCPSFRTFQKAALRL